MNHSELSVKTTITDLETKLDKNANPYFQLTVKWNNDWQTFYAFAHNLSAERLYKLSKQLRRN